MAVLDTAIHALRFKNRRCHASQPRLLGIRPTIFFAALAALLAGCSSSPPPPPPPVFAPLSYNYLPPIVLTVSNIAFQNSYVPDPAAAALISQDPAPPAATVMAMAQHRLVANGTPGTGTFTLETAAIEPVGDNYVGNISVRLDVVSADGRKTGYTEASVAVTQSAPDPDAGPDQVQAVLYSMTKQLMDQLNVQLQYQIQRNMGSWVSYNTNAATPALNSGSISNGGIQAAPLPSPGAAPAPVSGSPAPQPVPLPPGSGVLGQLPVTPQ
jgi:hypothetical protein